MSFKRWTIYLLILSSTILLLNSSFLYFEDAYSIVDAKPKKYYGTPNQKFAIVENILKIYKNYDTYIFGSSRVGSINPLKMKNKKAYNMTYGEGIPHEHLVIIKLFVKKKFPIKHILIGLDEFSYQVSFKEHQNKFIPKAHYLTTQDSLLDFYRFYFFRNIKKYDIEYFQDKYINHKDFIYNKVIYDGTFKQKISYESQNGSNNYSKEHMNHPIFSVPRLYHGHFMKDTLQDIKEIKKICDDNGIEVIFFINPIHHTIYKYLNLKEFNEFKDKISHITPFYDFSLPNKINNNNAYWHETSHYNRNVGDMILHRIYDNKQTIKNFGIYIKRRD